jgi:hypothetical protein
VRAGNQRARSIATRFAPALIAILVLSLPAVAEQKQDFGPWQVHYVVLPTTFLRPEIANQYEIVRGKDRSLLNVSVLDEAGAPVVAEASGAFVNLLGQRQDLQFTEVREGEAVYYLAQLKHANEETLRFELHIVPPGDTAKIIRFQQKLYWNQ